MRLFYAVLLIVCLLPELSHGQKSKSLFKDGEILMEMGRKNKAIKSFEAALQAAKAENNIDMQMNCHMELAGLNDNVINYKKALQHYQAFTELYKTRFNNKATQLRNTMVDLQTEVDSTKATIEEKDKTIEAKEQTIKAKEEEIDTKAKAIDALTKEQLQTNLELANLELANRQHELDIKASENKRNVLIFIATSFGLLFIFIWLRYLRKRKTNKLLEEKNTQISAEKEKSDELLLNILPEVVANELKIKGHTTPFRYDQATVMFTDFKGFTSYSEENSPEDIVALIDHYFSGFDQIIAKYKIEKIKTIGDAYLCVSGIPDDNPSQIEDMIKAAVEMQDFVKTSIENGETKAENLQMRIGIHCGPLVAGVVGKKKFAYDVWGDTVNIAARMEQSGQPGEINVSDSVYSLAKNNFDFAYRGEIEAKNKGVMKMYFLRPN